MVLTGDKSINSLVLDLATAIRLPKMHETIVTASIMASVTTTPSFGLSGGPCAPSEVRHTTGEDDL